MSEPQLTSNGQLLDTGPAALGELEPATDLINDSDALQSQLDKLGYLFLPGLIDPECVRDARREILLKYAIVGEIDGTKPLDDAVYCKNNASNVVNLRAFSESVREGLAYQAVVEHPALLEIHSKLLGGPAAAYDFRWPRFVRPGEACGIHCDGPYMSRGARTVYSSWIPLGDIAKYEGALMILERSEKHELLLADYLASDADRDQLEWLSIRPREWREQFGTRWLTADFQIGDVLCFRMDTVHGALDNNSPTGKCRLSSDTRYQLASEPFDQRWNGENPIAHGYNKVFYPGLGQWNNADFQDEWKPVDERGRLRLR